MLVVRRRNIEELEAQRRKHQRKVDLAERYSAFWTHEGLTLEQAKLVANFDQLAVCEEGESGDKSLWTLLALGEITVEEAACRALAVQQRVMARHHRWLEHIERRLAYEASWFDLVDQRS